MSKRGSIPHGKWVEIYNAGLFLLWFIDIYENQKSRIDEANKQFNAFCKKEHYCTNEQFLERGTNLIGIAQLIICRSHEILNEFLEDSDIKLFYDKLVKDSRYPAHFNGLEKKYEIKLTKDFKTSQDDAVTIRRLIKYLRHSISHFSYSLVNNGFEFTAEDGGAVKLKCYFEAHQFLNFTMLVFLLFNSTLRSNKLLSQ